MNTDKHRFDSFFIFIGVYLCLCVVTFAGNSNAQSQLLSPELEAQCTQGFQAIYQMDYKKGKEQFEKMIRSDPNHPAGYVYLASAIWLEHLSGLRRLQSQLYNRGNAFFRQKNDKTDPAIEKLFYRTIEKAKIRADIRLRSDNNDLTGLYYAGTAYGAIAGYESTVKRSFLSSLQHGKKAVEIHRRLLKTHPNFVDAYLSIGLYNYVIGKLPRAMKILMILGGVRGSKEEGLQQLERTLQHGKLAREEAAILLAVLYDREKRQEDSLKLLRALSEKYPTNPVFRFESATMLTKLGRLPDSIAILESLLKDEKARNYMVDFIQFDYAEILFSMGSWQKAYQRYLAARRVKEETPVGLITMSHLRSGQCLNAMGKNSEALIEYQYVLKQPNIQGSRALANQYLKQPFKGI
jgi:tetratricopeptide (TPR) repeat protein